MHASTWAARTWLPRPAETTVAAWTGARACESSCACLPRGLRRGRRGDPDGGDATDAPDDGEVAEIDWGDPDEPVFAPFVMHEIRLTVSDEAALAIQGADRPEVHAALAIDDLTFADVGLRMKGGSTTMPFDAKPSLIVDMNQWVSGTKYHGLKAFKLHNGVGDPTRTHEYLSYELARAAGLMAPRVGWAEVWINDGYRGVYVLVEKHDDVFLAHHARDEEDVGVVLEPEAGKDFAAGLLEPDARQGALAVWEEGPLPPAAKVLAALAGADALLAGASSEAALEALWQYVDEDAFYSYHAWETAVAHIDGYLTRNNWRLFVSGVDHHLQWLPTGTDLAWTPSFFAEPFGLFTGKGSARPWCFAIATCRATYLERVSELADLIEARDLVGRFRALSAWLAPALAEDPFVDASALRVLNDATVTYIAEDPAYLRGLVDAADR